MPKYLLLFLLLVPQDASDLEITVRPDAWPRLPRTIGQKFGMNARDNIPTELIKGESDDLGSDEITQGLKRNRYRITSVVVRNRRDAVLEGTLFSPQLQGQRKNVELQPGERARFFFVVPERLEAIRFELRKNASDVLGACDQKLGPGAIFGGRGEAMVVAQELQHEQTVRARFIRRRATVEARDEADKPIAGAMLTFVHAKFGMIVEGRTDERGAWSGWLLQGDWQVFARAVVDPKPVATGSTTTEGWKTLYYLAGTLAVANDPRPLKLVPDQAARVTAGGSRCDRITLVPTPFADHLRYESVHRAAAPLFALSVESPAPVHVQSTGNLLFDVLVWGAPRDKRGHFLHSSRLVLRGDVEVKSKTGSIAFDPAGSDRIDVSISFPDVPREVYSFSCTTATTLTVPQGLVRVEMTLVAKDAKVRFAPHLAVVRAQPVDLTPAGFSVTPCYQESRGLMVWAAIEDMQGKIVTRFEGRGEIAGYHKGQEIFKKDLSQLTFHFPAEFAKIPLADIAYGISLEIGGKKVVCAGKGLKRRVFADPPSSVEVPTNLAERALAMMPMIRRTLAGGQRFLDVPKFDLRVAFEIRLPPEVGGLGGGGVIMLDLGEILEYAHETDRLPGAYTHELGHNFGYGHDPYMTMAPCGVDEGLYGTAGYYLLNGRVPKRFLDHLDRDADPGEWIPSGDLWAALRMLYGPEVHTRMVDQKRKFAERLDKAGISIAEQMAAYYSNACGENLGWLFRAFGWPIFDYRVRYAQAVIQNQSLAVQQKLPKKIDGSYLTSWWMRGPFDPRKAVDAPWKIRTWEGRFVMLAADEDLLKDRGYHFYLTLQSTDDQVCLLSIGADVQVSFYVNGKRVSRVAAAPQFSQPMHDGYTMERGNATVVPIAIRQGENWLEMVVVKPAGSKGLFVELANSQGRPMQTLGTQLQNGPDDLEADKTERVVHPVGAPVLNPSFEGGAKFPEAWIGAAKDGDGELETALDDKIVHGGKRSLRLTAKGALSGGTIQRIVLEEEARYEVTAWIHTEGFRKGVDRAYVGLFTGSPTEGTIVETDVVDKSVPGWQKVTIRYTADRRCVYIGCILKAGGGAKAWFDDVQFKRVGR